MDGDGTDVSMSSSGLEDGNAVLDSSAPDSDSKARSARDVATPLAHLTYTDQLEHKKNSLMQTLKKLVSHTCSCLCLYHISLHMLLKYFIKS